MKRWCVGLLAALSVVLAACSSGGGAATATSTGLNGNEGSGKYAGFGLVPPQPRPSFVLTATSGKKFAFGTVTRGHPTLLYFGYTHCPDVCPETMADIRLALAKVPAAVADKTYVVFVTTDLKHDTAPVIKRWLSNFDAGARGNWVGLRGTQAQIDAAQAAAHVAVATDGGQTHSAEVLLYGSDDYARVTYSSGANQQKEIAHDLPLVATTSG